MDYNYHTHTWRCRHAEGTAEEYIQRAIANGMKHMGFSDHVPFRFPGGYESYYRIPVSEVSDYIGELRALREKYQDKIEIAIGFEMEYYPTHFEAMLENAIAWGGEYLILGQHFLKEEYPDIIGTTRPSDSLEHLKAHVGEVVAAMDKGVFSYIAHPDIFRFTGDDELYRSEMRRICTAAREYNVPLEINFLGIRSGRHYPNETFWQIAAEEKSPVTFGFDAHDMSAAYDGESLQKAEEMVKRLGLNYIGKPNIILLQ